MGSVCRICFSEKRILLHPSPTDTGAYVARPRPEYHNFKEKMSMRCTSSFPGTFWPTTFFLFSVLIGSVLSSLTAV